MATALDLGASLTLAEMIRRETPDGKLADLVDVLSQENRILEDITWIECNNGTYHEDTLVAFEPAGAERAYNEGVTKEAGGTEKVTEPTCMLDGISEVDSALIQRSPNPAGARFQEDSLFLKGMTKTFVSRLLDGDRSTDVRKINGINSRTLYTTLQTVGSETVVFDNAGGNASATSNKTSIYGIQWGTKRVNCIYPRNHPNGGGELPIKMRDFGENIINQSGTSETKKYPAFQTWFDKDFGLFIHDWRCVKRVVNISTTNINEVDDFGFSEDPLIDLYNQLEYGGAGAVLYCNRTIMSQIMKRANVKGNAFYTLTTEGEGPFAHPVTRFWGIPIKRVDQITNVQASVVAA